MFEYQQKLSAGLRIALVLFVIALIHMIGHVLGSLWLLSDGLLILGAITAYQLITDKEFRQDAVESLDGSVDVDGLAGWLMIQVTRIVSAFSAPVKPEPLVEDPQDTLV